MEWCWYSTKGRSPPTLPIKGGEVLARAGKEVLGTNPSNQEMEWCWYPVKGRSPLTHCGRGLGKLPLQQANHFVLSPLPLWERVRVRGILDEKIRCPRDGMVLVSYQGKKSPNSLWKRVREVTVAAGKSFCLVPSPLAGEG
jgi:hypothetical protein